MAGSYYTDEGLAPAAGSASPSGPASGDLGDSYPDPSVIAVHESSGPDKLTIGVIADGQSVKRQGTSLVGYVPSDSDELVKTDILDLNPGYLAGKLLASDNITLDVVTDGGIKKVAIAATVSNTSLPFSCQTTDSVGDAVRISGTGAVTKVDVTDVSSMPAIGVIVSKPTTTSCLVTSTGKAMVYSGLTAGSTYWIDLNGQPVTPPPVASSMNPLVCTQALGVAISATALLINVSPIVTVRVYS